MSSVADLKLRTLEKIAFAELRICGCGATFLLKVAELRLRKCFLQVAELRLRNRKKVARAHFSNLYGFLKTDDAGLLNLKK
jgi:hypothetical protein